MKFLALYVSLITLVSQAAAAHPEGIDVSGWQTSVNWAQVKNGNVSFVYIKATEGTTFKSDQFNVQYAGATNASIIRGAYHFAQPAHSTGAAQAAYFLTHGGGWSADGRTLPGALDIEYNPSGATCYGLSPAEMVAWVKSFSDYYESKTKRYPVIYTTYGWWSECTGNSAAFSTNNPLWIARFASAVGTIPAGWPYHTFWQYSDSSSVIGGDANIFNGDAAGLQRFAKGS